jgi:protein TonB
MFTTLLESRARRQRRTVSSITSVVFHGAIIAGAAMATAREGNPGDPPKPVVVKIEFSRPKTPPPPVEARPLRVTTASVAPSPLVLSLRMPDVVPIGIPPIDLTAIPTDPHYTQARIGTSGIICIDQCSATTRIDSSGRALWSSSDLSMRLASEPVPPRYPESLRRAGVEGDVIVKFVVDTTGRVDMGTVEIMQSTHDAFTAAVRETLARLRFLPSTVGERKVKALAVMPFRFTLK